MEITLLINIVILVIFLIILNKASDMKITSAVKTPEVARLGKRKPLRNRTSWRPPRA